MRGGLEALDARGPVQCASTIALQQRRRHGIEQHSGGTGKMSKALLTCRRATERKQRCKAQAVLCCALHANLHCGGGGEAIGRVGGGCVEQGL